MVEELDERAIFVRGPVVIFKWRNAPGWPVEYASPNVAEVFGHDADAFVQGHVAYGALILAEDVGRVAGEVTAAVASGASSFVHEPYRVRARGGEVRWLYDFTHVVRTAEGTATHFLGYVIDITERVQAEEAARELERRLFHAQKLESLGVLAGGVAHDFNNLLTGILGQASLARRRLAGVPGDHDGSLDQIERLARRAAELTRQLLAYSGKGSFVVEPIELRTLVDDLRGMLDVVAPKGAKLVVSLTDDVPPILADRAQLQQVVMNLLTNAAEAIRPAGGTITLRARRRWLDADEATTSDGLALATGDYVELEVEDDGCGMDEDVQRRLFDPFFTTKMSGRGLGMSAVLGIVRGHHGAIRVTSSPGAGTTFRLLLPASKEPVRAASPAPRPRRPKQATVLVVDDEAMLRTTLSAILRHLGYAVLTAGDGAEALRVFEANQDAIALVLMDVTMPVMSGPEALRTLKSLAPSLPVVLTSGYGEIEAAQASGEAKADAFLEKPFDVEAVERVLAALSGREEQSATR